MAKSMRPLLVGSLVLLVCFGQLASGQLPDDIQRELNQNLAEQARLQAQRARHQQLMQARAAAGKSAAPQAAIPQQQQQQPHDPNNYSYQQVSPPIQYSYYQPYGDLAKDQQPQGRTGGGSQSANAKPINIDLNNLNLDDLSNLPTPQAQTAASGPNHEGGQMSGRRQLTPSFTGAGGLPVLQPVAAAANGQQRADAFTPTGQAPLPPQAQQGPPLTEADFKDITGGENYGAPGGSDFGMGASRPGGSGAGTAEPRQDEDEQLREFGMPAEGAKSARSSQADNPSMQTMGMANDFGSDFNPTADNRRITGGGGGGGGGGFDPFGGQTGGMPFGDFGGLGVPGGQRRRQPARGSEDFDFAGEPSSRSQGGNTDRAQQTTLNGAAPGSLQSLLGNSFPGLGGGGNGDNLGLDGLARGAGAGNSGDQAIDTQLDSPQRGQRADDGSLDVAELGDRADGFAGADLGGFEQPTPQNDQDYNYAMTAAAAEQQPKSVPYPDGGPQLVGTLWAVSQPQSLLQARYNPMPDKGTYQDYPAYKAGGNDFSAVRAVVGATPRARSTGPGRYGQPAAADLAPELRHQVGARMDYAQPPEVSLASDFSEPATGSGANSIERDNFATTSNELENAEFF